MSFNKKVAEVAGNFDDNTPDDASFEESFFSDNIEMEATIFNNQLPKVAQDFHCEFCDYSTSKTSNWKKHLKTKTHAFNKPGYFFNNSITCKNCNKTYKDRTGLWYHSKKCNPSAQLGELKNNAANILDNPVLLMELMKQNTEFKNLIIDQNKTIMELAKSNSVANSNSYNNNNNTNNSHNKFNLNFFLNEQCKDAMSIKEFIDNIKLNITDLDVTREYGLAESISRIFVRNLKEIDIYKRPIHCCDLKREIVYLKDENGWIKDDDDKKKLASLIRNISNKNIKQISDWVAAHPNCKDSSSPYNDNYLMMMSESMGSFCDKENELIKKKIIRNVLKNVVIDKNK